MPPGRPKEWRKNAFKVLEKVVSQRIEGNQFEDRDSNKNWLIRHLEVSLLSSSLLLLLNSELFIYLYGFDFLRFFVHLSLFQRLITSFSFYLCLTEFLIEIFIWVFAGDPINAT